MYTYRMYNRYSTKKSEVHNDQGEVVAYIERTYSNPFMRLLDIMTEGSMFADYRITDANDKLVVGLGKNHSGWEHVG
ncbi:hypothetical protein PAECIP111893_01516 [Paenibacillus plantiphilus]|uniref:Tubby C-terminal domain-containing protein n=1 Tax=Paenibacillus plantiphilus TaxID=2905650 RepID=A0ABN8GCY9_9BACL|nr:hypothetical protein [Paenibacillus plantiphilus]CAH1200636.1 hypothetical protein PAECIP111893_01516 [Paenibacillus plantiphilus]